MLRVVSKVDLLQSVRIGLSNVPLKLRNMEILLTGLFYVFSDCGNLCLEKFKIVFTCVFLHFFPDSIKFCLYPMQTLMALLQNRRDDFFWVAKVFSVLVGRFIRITVLCPSRFKTASLSNSFIIVGTSLYLDIWEFSLFNLFRFCNTSVQCRRVLVYHE